MSRTKKLSRAQETWRIASNLARSFDRHIPDWWKKPDILDDLFAGREDLATRCWRELIKQREGR